MKRILLAALAIAVLGCANTPTEVEVANHVYQDAGGQGRIIGLDRRQGLLLFDLTPEAESQAPADPAKVVEALATLAGSEEGTTGFNLYVEGGRLEKLGTYSLRDPEPVQKP